MEILDRYLVSKTIGEDIAEGQNVLGIVFYHVYKQKNKKRIDGTGFLGWNYQLLAKPSKFII